MKLQTEERIHQFELVPGASDRLNSHVMHEFEIREQPTPKCGGTKGKCRKLYFQISEDDNQVFVIEKDFKVHAFNSQTRAKSKARETVLECQQFGLEVNTSSHHQRLDQLAACMIPQVHDTLYELQEEIEFQAELRNNVSSRLTQHACQDSSFFSAEPIISMVMEHNDEENQRSQHNIHVHLHMQDTTVVATIDSMVTKLDCAFVRRAAVPSHQNPAHWVVPWEARKDLAAISLLARIYKHINPAIQELLDNFYHAGLPVKGEDLFRLHYHHHHLGVSSNIFAIPRHLGDRSLHDAQLYLFCEVAEEGGAIHFSESGVHLYPKVGDGLLVVTSAGKGQDGAADLRHHHWLTNKHLDCPIARGSRITVQHSLRLVPNDKQAS